MAEKKHERLARQWLKEAAKRPRRGERLRHQGKVRHLCLEALAAENRALKRAAQ